ncbi:hypothetical protein KEM56_000514 [Ascosphaera pollenicola]|nr:hypothetical protein KEM56_000514 [Ascosphaera pollenicola]
MSFHETAKDITLEDGHILKCILFNSDGEEREAELDLNYYLGNVNGVLEWGETNFADSAEDITFDIEGDDNIPVLRCQCGDGSGETFAVDKNLAERIGNDNGTLVFLA